MLIILPLFTILVYTLILTHQPPLSSRLISHFMYSHLKLFHFLIKINLFSIKSPILSRIKRRYKYECQFMMISILLEKLLNQLKCDRIVLLLNFFKGVVKFGFQSSRRKNGYGYL